MMKGNPGFRIKSKSQYLFNKLIDKAGGYGIYDITGPSSKKDRHALIIYSLTSVSPFLSNNIKFFKDLNSHSGFWEAIEMLNILLDLGYTVDYFHLKDTPAVNWGKYELVIDATQILGEKEITVKGQKTIYYSTACHWNFFNKNAIRHSDAFVERHSIPMIPDRLFPAHYSADHANVITMFGNGFQRSTFLSNAPRVKRIQISTTHIPQSNGIDKKTDACKTRFIWFAGYGVFHKGLDLVADAFRELPQAELFVVGNAESTKAFYSWFSSAILPHYKNIQYLGWMTPESESFRTLADSCCATICLSSSEGGAGAVIQAQQLGLIPIVNYSTAVDVGDFGIELKSEDPNEQIKELRTVVSTMMQSDLAGLKEKMHRSAKHAIDNHTRERYSSSFRSVITSL